MSEPSPPTGIEEDAGDRASRAVAAQQAMLQTAWKGFDRLLIRVTSLVLFAVSQDGSEPFTGY